MKNDPCRFFQCVLVFVLLMASGCRPPAVRDDALFSLLDPRETGVSFVNALNDEPEFNILEYLYFYDGGGVALGDVNRDGLPDIFLTGNQAPNRLYLNRGGFRFEDVSERAGITDSAAAWSTGVTMADVDGDGWLDIYVCRVNYRNKSGRNQLYINNRDGTFSDRAAAYGLDFEGLSTQAAFFDYDRDGDLDMYLLNHSVHTQESFVPAWRRIVDAPRVGDRLYRNDGVSQFGAGRFTNVTSDAGIYSSTLGYGLGLAISDVNGDGWPDVYVGNDFHENDYLYLNRGDGTFAEALQHAIGHTGQSSMGNDVADINNDGRVDILSLDMLPADVATYRKSGGPDADELARIKRDFGYLPQYSRNTLQLNRGAGADGLPLFSEIGLYAGIQATDWSWAGLLVDLDGDGWKDIYVTNGIPRRPNDLDYIEYISSPSIQQLLNQGSFDEQMEVTRRMPALAISNYAFRNQGDLRFADETESWGLSAPGYSNGAAYGDLDGDGDVDLVVNNIDAPAFIYRNNSERGGSRHFITVKLEGAGGNTTGIGARVSVFAGGMHQYQEQMPVRGFQSSVPHTLYFGLGASTMADSLHVIWPDGRFQQLDRVVAGEPITLRQDEAAEMYSPAPESSALLFEDVTAKAGLHFKHREDEFEDIEIQPLLPHRLSTRGPALAVADVNGDGLDDVFLGGAHDQAGALFVQRRGGGGMAPVDAPFTADAAYEDVDAAFFDADDDGDADLYVVSGGGRLAEGDPTLQDRLYLNDGRGHFSRSEGRLPGFYADGCCIAPADFDGDGDLDLFVGTRAIFGAYGYSPASYLLENDGRGYFTDVTSDRAPALLDAGMVTDAGWANVTGDEHLDLVLVGEWMPVSVFENAGDSLTPASDDLGLDSTAGWWNSLLADDFDGDGDTDLVAGNLGANTVFRAPLELYVQDFDNNGTMDPIIAEHREGEIYTWARRDELLQQLPALGEKLATNAIYSRARLTDLFDEEELETAQHKRAYLLESSYFENRGDAGFMRHSLPPSAQWSPIMDMLSGDFDGDGQKDILSVGNFFGSDTKQGRYDADYGTLLVGKSDGTLVSYPLFEHGFIVRGEARAVRALMLDGERTIIVARNDDAPQIFEISNQ